MPRDMIDEAPIAPVDEKAEVRARWIEELRRQGHRQCHGAQNGSLAGRNDDTVCAIRLAYDMLPTERPNGESIVVVVADETGLSYEQAATVLMLNDGRRVWWADGKRVSLPSQFKRRPHTFSEIADIVEGWFP